MKTAKYVQKQKTRKEKIQMQHRNQRRIEAKKRAASHTRNVLLTSPQISILAMVKHLAQRQEAIAAQVSQPE